MFGFISGKSLRSEVGVMVGEFARICPPPARLGVKRVSDGKIEESLGVLYSRVAAFARVSNLGVIGRARLAKALQDEMRRNQYPAELVGRLVNAVTANALVGPVRR